MALKERSFLILLISLYRSSNLLIYRFSELSFLFFLDFLLDFYRSNYNLIISLYIKLIAIYKIIFEIILFSYYLINKRYTSILSIKINIILNTLIIFLFI